MKNKAKLAFELLEQEMEVIYKEDLMQFTTGSSSGVNWGNFANFLNDPYFLNSQFWGGSNYSNESYSIGGYGGVGYYVSSDYIINSGTNNLLDTKFYSLLEATGKTASSFSGMMDTARSTRSPDLELLPPTLPANYPIPQSPAGASVSLVHAS